MTTLSQPSYELRDYQQDLTQKIFAGWSAGSRRVLAQLPTGGGKCLGKDTPVLMFDGTIRLVQDIQAGDLLMGDDSKPRKVLSTCRGREEMFEVVPVKGDSWQCNRSHILSLVYNGDTSSRWVNSQTYDLSINEYLQLPSSVRHCLKLYHVSVDYPEIAVDFDPYILGVWLGDGTEGRKHLTGWSGAAAVSTIKPEIINSLQNWATSCGATIRTEVRSGIHNSQTLHIRSNSRKQGSNPFVAALNRYGLRGNKHIPLDYLTNSRRVRLELLAGLIDTDGYVHRTGVEIVQKRKLLSQQIAQLCRSLGYRVLASQKVVNNQVYYKLNITGDLSEVPVRVGYKQIPARKQKKDALRTGFKLQSLGEGDYYGFEIDGNRRFLLGDFTVTHNTVLVAAIAQQFTQRNEKVLFLAHREELLLQAKEKLESITGCTAGLIKAGYRAAPQHQIQIASVQSLIRRQHYFEAGLVVVDEAHHSCAATYVSILERYPNAYILGVTATPARSDGQGFKNQYDALVLGQSVRELIDAGHLCLFKLFAAKNRIKAADIKVTAGDFNQRELAQRVNTTLTLGDVVGTWQKHAAGKRTVVFCVDVAHSRAVADAFLQAGYAAEHIDGETPGEERRAILERFRTGETAILTNCGIVSEGLDVPGIEAVQCLRPTRSLVLYLQMVGRGLRPSAGKNCLMILDHTENWIYHGLPDEQHEWSLDPVSLRNAERAVECPDCQHCFKPQPHEQKSRGATCPNCGTTIQLEEPGEGEAIERVIEHDEAAALEEIDLETNPVVMAALQRLKELQQQHRYKAAWVYHKLIEQFPNVGLAELRECARLLGYKDGWAWYRWQELQQRRAA